MPAQSRHNLQIKGMYTCLEICDPRRTGGTGAPSCSCSRRSKGHRCVLQLMPQMTNRKFAAGKREMDQKTPCLPAMLAYHWRELPQVSFLLWQRRICRDKMCFVTTKLSLWLLFWQAYFCCNKHVCPEKTHLFLCVTKVCLSWQTRVCCDKSFVATKIFCHNIILLQQAYFCCNKRCVLLWQKRYLAGLLPQPSRLMGSGTELELKNFSGATKTIPVLTFATAIHFQASLVGIMLSHNELCTARSILSCCLWPCYVTILWGGYSPFNSELLSVAMLCYHTVRWVQPINAKLLSVAMLCYHTVRWVQPINAELLSVAMLCYHTVRWVQPIQFWAVVCGHAMGRPLQEKTLWAYSQLGLEVKMVLLRHHDSQTIIIKRWQRNRWHCYQRKKK